MSHWQPWSLRELVTDLAAGRTTPELASRRARQRIAETEPDVAAWVELGDPPTTFGALRGALSGVPMGVKDIIDLAGFPTRCGSRLRAQSAAAERDAAIVDAWRMAGADPIGKTVTTEFAYFAPGPTRNPVNLEHTPGGSSSGSAAAVAAGQVPLAIGSQTAASVTRPAAYCGVAALVMRRGRFPVDGVVGLSESLDAHGVYAATVSDLALAWSALTAEPDIEDMGAAPRLAVWRAEHLGVSDEMAAAVAGAGVALSGAGAQIDPYPDEQLIAEVTAAHPVIMAYEAARERAVEAARADELSEPLATLLRAGECMPVADYTAARQLVARAGRAVGETLGEYDAILGPAALGAAPRGHGATGDPAVSRPWQALGLSAVTVPGLRDAEGLPLGLQVVAGTELTALRVAAWVERHLTA